MIKKFTKVDLTPMSLHVVEKKFMFDFHEQFAGHICMKEIFSSPKKIMTSTFSCLIISCLQQQWCNFWQTIPRSEYFILIANRRGSYKLRFGLEKKTKVMYQRLRLNRSFCIDMKICILWKIYCEIKINGDVREVYLALGFICHISALDYQEN